MTFNIILTVLILSGAGAGTSTDHKLSSYGSFDSLAACLEKVDQIESRIDLADNMHLSCSTK